MGGSLARNPAIEQWLDTILRTVQFQVHLCVFYPDSPPCKCLPPVFEAQRRSQVFLQGRIFAFPSPPGFVFVCYVGVVLRTECHTLYGVWNRVTASLRQPSKMLRISRKVFSRSPQSDCWTAILIWPDAPVTS